MTTDEKLDKILEELDFISGMLCRDRDNKERIAKFASAIENDECMDCGAPHDHGEAPESGPKLALVKPD